MYHLHFLIFTEKGNLWQSPNVPTRMSYPAPVTPGSEENIPGSEIPSLALSPSFRLLLTRQAGCSVGFTRTLASKNERLQKNVKKAMPPLFVPSIPLVARAQLIGCINATHEFEVIGLGVWT
jgi:hypothetical protein